MKERVLYICLTEGWGVQERAVIRDMLLSKQMGNDVYLYTLRDSYLDIKAHSLQLPTFHFLGKVNTKFYKWGKFKNIFNHIKKNDISLVHCYDENVIWPVAYYVRKFPLVPVILSLYNKVEKNYKGVLYRTLSRRIDQITNFNSVHLKTTLFNLGIRGIKVHQGNIPIVDLDGPKMTRARFLKHMGYEKEEELFLLGSYIDTKTKEISHITPLLNALSILTKNNDFEIRMVLFSEKNWGNSVIYPEIIHYMKEVGLEDEIVFYKANCNIYPNGEDNGELAGNFIEEILPVLDVWTIMENSDQLDDLTLTALSAGVPVLGARNASLKQLLDTYPECGETSREGDSREIRTKLLKIKDNMKSYRKNLKRIIPELEQNSSLKSYAKSLKESYEGAMRRRLRIFNKKKRSK